MLIGGLQKMTLLDYAGKVACIVFTHGCNFRCPYCHNAPLVKEAPECVSEEELFAFLKKRRGILDGVVVSGGEPTLQKDIIPFLEKIKALGYSVKLDTNGTDPAVLGEIVSLGLCDYVAMDIKNSREKYALAAGCEVDIKAVEKSVSLLLSGEVDYEFRTTVTRELHGEEDMRGIGEWIKGAKRYFLQTFVDSGSLVGEGMSAYSAEEMKALADAVRPYIPSVTVR
jgi:pyruvate formate lyase activating enzyme